MTSLDDLEFMDAATPPMLAPAPPRKCSHPKADRVMLRVEAEDSWAPGCGRCGHLIDPSRVKAGRNARANGKRLERVEMRKAGIHTGNANKADDGLSVDGMFAYQSKAMGTSRFPGWQALELDKLRQAHGTKVPVLVMVELPGRGRKGRKLAVVEWSDWLELHGAPQP